MSEAIQLVTTKPDAELAEEIKQELAEALKPVLEISTKALRMGFNVQWSLAPNGFKEMVIQQLNLIKVY